MTRFLIAAPRWLLLALLVYAPWAYGCTRPWTIEVLNRAMLVLLVLWLVGCAFRKLRPVVPPILGIGAACLLLQGWWMISNAQYYFDRVDMKFVPIPSLWSFAPGVVDQWDSIPVMVRLTGLLGIACFVSDLALREEWRRRIWWTIGFCGGTLILWGLIQRVLGAPMIFWEGDRTGEHFFATYFYHGNAGAFVNLVFPLIAGQVLVAFRHPEANPAKAAWLPALLITLAGAVATASKAAIVITLVLAVALLLWRRRTLTEAWRRIPAKSIRLLVLAAALLLVFILGWFGWERMRERWADEEWVSFSWELRLNAYRACCSMVPDAGMWGFGPGNFTIMFPFYTNELGNKIEGFWRFAHEDYLQTLVEWGYIGAAVWTVPFFGGIWAGIRAYRRRSQALPSADRILLFTTLLAMFGVAIHATMDFPLQIASLQLYVAVYLGLLWSSASWKSSRSGERAGAS